MRTKEIGTVAIAGLISLAALNLLQNQSSPTLPIAENSTEKSRNDLRGIDRPSLGSVPAPTAEPPSNEQTNQGAEAPNPAADGSGGNSPARVTDLKPVAGSDPLPERSEMAETPESTPVDDSPISAMEADSSRNQVVPAANPAEESPGDTSTLSNALGNVIKMATGEPTTASNQSVVSGETPAPLIEANPSGFWLREAKLNDVFQHLSQLGNYQYFHNSELDGPSFIVTGQLMDDDPIKQMEELALMYGVTIHTKGNTVYALNSVQLTQLPTEPFRYHLKYLRPSDIEQIKMILQPFLTPGAGIIEYESKTNTLIVMDNSRRLDALALFLDEIDQPRQQVAIETRILRVRSGSRNQIGVDWSSVLGGTGISIGASTSLNSLFNLPELYEASSILTTGATGQTLDMVTNTSSAPSSGGGGGAADGGLVLTPVQLQAVVRALNTGDLAQQESNPTLITEDNEEGLISIIDRVPIITATVSETTAGQNITEEVRYTIDTSDPVGDPSTTREVGVSVSVTPTILPDGTIRMSLRPRSAQIVEFIQGANGNSYPRVNESTVTTTARVPNGHSLLIGGFYEEVERDGTNKVPLLGDIPAVSLLFKSSDREKEHTSLVFIVTPRLYQPNIGSQNDLISHETHDLHVLPSNHDYPDRFNPGNNHRSDFNTTRDNLFDRLNPDPPSNLLHPEHPYNLPETNAVHGKTHEPTSEPQFRGKPSVTVRPVEPQPKKPGIFGIFGNKRNR
ncbi:MAG: hypothetical protein ACPGFB_00045 [Verrucomicrobiales bacterium]